MHVKGNLILNDSNYVVDEAVRGTGLVYTAEETISEHLKAGRLEVILKPYVSHSAGYYLYYPKRSQILPKLRAFIDHLKENRI